MAGRKRAEQVDLGHGGVVERVRVRSAEGQDNVCSPFDVFWAVFAQ